MNGPRSGALSRTLLGWDVGAGAIRVARQEPTGRWRTAARTWTPSGDAANDALVLAVMLRELARDAGAGPAAAHAVTTTLDRAPVWPARRAALDTVLDAFAAALPDAPVELLTTEGRFVDPAAARRPDAASAIFGAGGGAAGALAAVAYADALADEGGRGVLVTVDGGAASMLPIVDGAVRVQGRTDAERLVRGELLWCGALHTPVAVAAPLLPLDGALVPAANGCGAATMEDVHVWRGELGTGDAAERRRAGTRLARLVGADVAELGESGLGRIAAAAAEAQCASLGAAIRRACEGAGAARPRVALVAGAGELVAAEAARAAGLVPLRLRVRLGTGASASLAACGTAWLRAAETMPREPHATRELPLQRV